MLSDHMTKRTQNITRDAQKWKNLKERIELSYSDHAATNINTMKDDNWWLKEETRNATKYTTKEHLLRNEEPRTRTTETPNKNSMNKRTQTSKSLP